MSHIPSIQVPELPRSMSRIGSGSSVPSKTPKSLLRNLFGWRKNMATQDKQSPLGSYLHDAIRPQTSGARSQHSISDRDSYAAMRSRSDTTVPQRSKTRSRSRKRSRSRVRVAWDPPPLFHAHTQACMHDTLQVPSWSLLDWLPLSPTAKGATKNPETIDDDRDDLEPPSSCHHRSSSSSSTSSMSRKQFFLLENGHILQYKAEGSQDRLPERVVELSRDSVAFASDAIAGKHWVLEIYPYGKPEGDTKSYLSRPPWPRMPFGTPENKRLAEKLLIIFESPENLFSWLIAIRKQIEGLGGMEYQPDMPTQTQTEPSRPALRHASSEHFKRKPNRLPFSYSSSDLPLRSDLPSTHEKELPQIPTSLTYQNSVSARSTAASSVTTRSSLERLRESYSGSSATGTALSSDMSAASLSPTRDCFHLMMGSIVSKEIPYRSTFDKLGLKSPTSPRNFSFKTPPPSDPSQTAAKEPESNRIVIVHDNNDEKAPETDGPQILLTSPTEFHHINTASPGDRPRSALGLLSASGPRGLLSGEGSNSPHRNPERLVSRTETHHVSKPSLSSGNKGTYGLFPQRLALNVKVEPLVIPDQNHVPGLLHTQATDHLHISASPITPVAANFGNSIFARSNATFKRPAPIAVPAFLAPAEPEQPLRSPAVSDAMLDSNFGTSGSDVTRPSSPVDVQVPDFNDIEVDKTLFSSVKVIEGHNVSPAASTKSRMIRPRRSMPNFHYDPSDLITAPVGPPPSGPLPAVPNVDEAWTSRSLPSSRRTSAQSSSNRRASTKSTSTVRKVPSAYNSTCLPPQIVTRNASLRSRRPSPSQSRADSPASTSTSPQKSQKVITTIGQVSVVSTPPRESSLPQHKKSLSASSIKSHRSRRSHIRTASGKSIHATVSRVSSITHRITPSCASEFDFDQADRGCFGGSGVTR